MSIAYVLVFIGISLLVIWLVCLALGFLYRPLKVTHLWEEERVVFNPRTLNPGHPEGQSYANFYFRLPSQATLKGRVRYEQGPFDFDIQDYIGFPPPVPHGSWATKTYVTGRHDTNTDFEISMQRGTYFIRFKSENSPVRATFTLRAEFRLKPLRKLVDVGWQLFSVGMPVLITGIVLLAGLPPS